MLMVVVMMHCLLTDMFSEGRPDHCHTGGGWWMVGRNTERHYRVVS